VKLRLSLFEFFGETLAVFEFVEVGGDGVGRSFPYGLLEMLEEGLGRRSEGRGGERRGGTQGVHFFAGLLAGFGVSGGDVDFCSVLHEAF
jgi:hypothetical protein